jgi:hypothetical protein
MAYNSSQLDLAVQHLCPGLEVNVDYELNDIGHGPFVGQWHTTKYEQPTQEQLAQVDTDALLAQANIPQTVSPRQARLALFAAGMLDQAQAAVDAAGGATKITWEYATEIRRSEPLIDTLGQQLGLSDEQIDALFVYASKQ